VKRLAIVMTVAVSVALGLPLSASAQVGGGPITIEQHGGLPDLDVRASSTVPARPLPVQLEALRRLDGASATWNQYGTPKLLLRPGGFLSGPSAGDPERVARSFLAEHGALFLGVDDSQLELEMRDPVAHNGVTHLRFGQRHLGLEVHGSDLLVTVDGQGRLALVGGNVVPGPTSLPIPLIPAAEAVTTAAAAVRAPGAGSPLELLEALPGPSQLTTFRNTLAPAALTGARPVTAELVVFPMPSGLPVRLAWRVTTEVSADGWYESVVDAVTGELLYRQNLYADSGPEGNVHTGDDPGAGSQQIVPFTGIDGTWVEGRTTAGNNVHAYQDLHNDNDGQDGDRPQTAAPPHPSYQHFDYPFTNAWSTSGGTDVATDRDAVVTQLFYYTNWFHDYVYGLGFTETARNFQNDNFGRGGNGNDRVLAEADNGYGTGSEKYCTDNNGDPDVCRNNANFGTPADGTSPVMQMFVGEVDTDGDGANDRFTQRAMNRDTLIHEYTHGISGRIISNQNLEGGAQSGAMGEGWSDFLAISINNDPVYGEYNNGNTTTGIRNVAYNNSTLQYSDVCQRARDSSNNPVCQVHTDGEVWATTLWDMRSRLIVRYGFAGGKQLAEQLVVDGMKNTPNQPSFLDARDGILTADLTNNSGANRCLIWKVFADREMGLSASSSADQETVTAGSDVPSDCTPTAKAGGPYTTSEGTPVALDATSSSDPNGESLSYEWDFDGDGVFDDATGASPNFTTVGDDGVVTVKVRVTNASRVSAEAATTVTVLNVAPSVDVTAPTPGTVFPAGPPVQVTAVFSDAGVDDTHSCSVDWGDGGPAASGTVNESSGSGTCAADHSYTAGGEHVVVVTVTDDEGAASSDSVTIRVNLPPVVDAGPDVAGQEGSPVALDATVSDPEGDPLVTSWTSTSGPGTDGGVACAFADAGAVDTTIICTDDGSFSASLAAQDGLNAPVSSSAVVTLANVVPAVGITSPQEGQLFALFGPRSDVQVTAPFTDDGRNDTHTCTVQWGDGVVGPGTVSETAGSGTCTASHVYTQAGVHTITVTVTDDDGGAGNDSVNVDVRDNVITGGAYGQKAATAALLGILSLSSGPAPSVILPSAGGGPFTAAAPSVSVGSLLSGNVLSASGLRATTEGRKSGAEAFVRSSADVATARVGGSVVTIEGLHTECVSAADGSRASTTVSRIVVNGVTLVQGPLAANRELVVPGVGTVVLNEQTGTHRAPTDTTFGETSITVNGAHIRLFPGNPLASSDVVLAQSRCGLDGPAVT
jgi:hypothetical protein